MLIIIFLSTIIILNCNHIFKDETVVPNYCFIFFPFCFFSKLWKHTIDSITPVVSNASNSSSIVNLIYKNGVLNIKGLTGIGNVTIYSIIGNEIAAYYKVNLGDFQRNITLDTKTMYIVRVEFAGEIKTYKLVAR